MRTVTIPLPLTRTLAFLYFRMPTATTPARPSAINYYEWCQDHNKPLQVAPFGDVAAGGPATLPDANIFTNGAWYGGSPYLGPDATLRVAQHLPQPACRPPADLRPRPARCNLRAFALPLTKRLCFYVALAQRARDYHQQCFPRRNADDDAG